MTLAQVVQILGRRDDSTLPRAVVDQNPSGQIGLNIVPKLSTLDVHGVLATPLLFPCCTFSMLLYFFYISLFPCCTLLILKSIENERKTENTTKNHLKLSIVNLFHFYFDILHHIFVII